MSETIQPDGWPRPSGYADAVSAAGRIIALAGQVGWNPKTSRFETDELVAQTAQALRNIVTILHKAGAQPRHVIRLTWYICDRGAYQAAAREIGRVYREVFGAHYPAMTLVVVAGLLEPRAKVEIEATAVLPAPGTT